MAKYYKVIRSEPEFEGGATESVASESCLPHYLAVGWKVVEENSDKLKSKEDTKTKTESKLKVEIKPEPKVEPKVEKNPKKGK